MKWSLETKIIGSGLALFLLFLGLIRFVSYENAIALIQSSNQVQHSEQVLGLLAEFSTSLMDAEAGRLTYLLLGDLSELERHQQAWQDLHQQMNQLQRLTTEQDLQQNLTQLRSLIEQRMTLANQSIAVYQTDPAAIDNQTILIDQLHQNRLAIDAVLEHIQAQETQVLDRWKRQSMSDNRHHMGIEFLGTLFIFVVLLSLYALLYRQVHQRRTAEMTQLRLANEKETSESKLRFFSMISHELRTPLSIILGSTQALAENNQIWSQEKQQSIFDRIQSAARSMNQLLTDILTLSRAQAGKLEFHPQQIDVEAFCLNLIEDFRFANEPCQTIKFESQGCCSYAMLDEKLLHSILSNLLSNAFKYSPPESTICFSLVNEADAVSFQLHDQGIGVPVADQATLFEPFHRGQNIGKTSGAGLGLAVVKACLDLHQGEIAVESDVDTGTTFSVKFRK